MNMSSNLSYTQTGDYLLPNLTLHQPKTPLGKYGRMRLSFLRQQRPVLYNTMLLNEPTRGIDVGAKYEIYCIIADLAKQGKSIIMISSEMSEIIGMSNRVMVMCDGRITGFIDGKDATQENIMALATQFETAPDAAAANQ